MAATYMEDLRGFLVDEQRPVTYSFLSSSLSVPADTAKRMLYQFAQENSESVQATYLISGWIQGESTSRKRVVKLVAEGDLEGERKRMVDVVCTHVFSLVPKGALNRDGGVPQTPPRKSMLAGMLWAADHESKQQQYTADAAVTNCLRDNRHSHIKYPKAVRDLKPKQLFPQSPVIALSPSPAASSSKAATPVGKQSAPKLSASEQAFKDRADAKGAAKPAAPVKLSAAEQRMNEIAQGKGPAAKGNNFFVASSGKSKPAAAKAEKKKEEEKQNEKEKVESDEGSDDERFKKKEAKPMLDFTFDDEKPAAPKRATNKVSARRKPAVGRGKNSKKEVEKDFINDASSESEESEAEEKEGKEEEEEAKPIQRRKRVSPASDSEEEEEGCKAKGAEDAGEVKKMFSFKKKGMESDEEDSGDDSDSSCASQHTNASDPDAEVAESKKAKASKEGDGSGESDSDEDAPPGKLVIRRKDGSKVVKKESKRKACEEEGSGKKKRKPRKKKDDDDDESPSKPKGRKRKSEELGYGQTTLDASMFTGEAAPKETGPVRRKKKVERTQIDEKGYIVTEEVWVDASGDEGDEVPAAADGGAPGEAGAEESTEASTEKKKTKAPESKPKPAAAKKDVPKKEDAKKKGNPKTQGSIMNFFAKK